jgi:hypothetical protein
VRANGAGFALRFKRVQAFYREAIFISEQNVEIAKRAMDGYNTRDLDYELIAPDFEWTTAMAGVDNEVMRGREGVDNYYESLDAVWEHVRALERSGAISATAFCGSARWKVEGESAAL